MKITKKLQAELIEFNRVYRKPAKQRPLTIEEYIRYVTGKGLPETTPKPKTKKLSKVADIPVWASNTRDIPSVEVDTGYFPLKNSIMDRLQDESPEIQAEILKKKNRIAIPYSKGAYQYVTDESVVSCLGRKL